MTKNGYPNGRTFLLVDMPPFTDYLNCNYPLISGTNNMRY